MTWLKTLFYLSGLFPFLLLLAKPPMPVFVVYSLFVLLVFLMDIRVLKTKKKASFNRFYIVYLVISLFVFEVLSWTSSYLECKVNPDLLHSQLLWDLLLGIFFYSGLALGWIWAFKYSRYSVIDVFIIQGIFGVFIEGLGKTFYSGLMLLPAGIILWVLLYVVYGAFGASAFLLAEPPGKAVKKDRVKRYAVGLGCIALVTVGITLLSNIIFSVLGLPPVEQPICSSPFI